MAGEAEAVEPLAGLPAVVEAESAPFTAAPEPFAQPGQGFNAEAEPETRRATARGRTGRFGYGARPERPAPPMEPGWGAEPVPPRVPLAAEPTPYAGPEPSFARGFGPTPRGVATPLRETYPRTGRVERGVDGGARRGAWCRIRLYHPAWRCHPREHQRADRPPVERATPSADAPYDDVLDPRDADERARWRLRGCRQSALFGAEPAREY